MGVLIYKSGEVSPVGYKDEASLDAFLTKAEDIKDGFGSTAFFVTRYSIEFACDTTEGCCDPYEDAVGKPIDSIIKLAKKCGVELSGSFDIGSSSSDYDGITVTINNNNVTTCDTHVLNATDKELVSELERRGYAVTKIA